MLGCQAAFFSSCLVLEVLVSNRPPHGLNQCLRWLRARQSVLTRDDEKRNAVNAKIVYPFDLSASVLHVFFRRKATAYVVPVHAAICRRLRQHIVIANIGDVPLNVENCGSGLASFDDYAAFDVSSSPKWLA